MDKELVLSVVVITYNQEKTISKTLDSILEQEHDYPYEIIVGDDCSVDGTKSIIEDYVLRYPKIVKAIYNKENMGLIKNYYNVISNCSGKYIMECAGDDWWLQGKVKTQIEFMESHNDVGMCYCQAKVWIESRKMYYEDLIGEDYSSYDDLLKVNIVPALSICLRMKLVNVYIREIKPIERGWLTEDYPMWLWFFKNTKVEFLKKGLVVYRELEESASHSKDCDKILAFERSRYEIQTFFAKRYNGICPVWDEDRTRFNLYYAKLFENYEPMFVEKLNKVYAQLENKSFREKLIHCISLYKIVFILHKKILRLFPFKSRTK